VLLQPSFYIADAVILPAQLYLSIVSDGLGQLIGPSQGAVAQQAATKFHQVLNFDHNHIASLLEPSVLSSQPSK